MDKDCWIVLLRKWDSFVYVCKNPVSMGHVSLREPEHFGASRKMGCTQAYRVLYILQYFKSSMKEW
jgi:hypothetical protein